MPVTFAAQQTVSRPSWGSARATGHHCWISPGERELVNVDSVTLMRQILDIPGAVRADGEKHWDPFRIDSDAKEHGDAFRIDSDGADTGIVVIVTPQVVEFRLPTLEWTSPYEATPTTRLWRREPIAKLTQERLAELVTAGKQARRNEFEPCRFCGRKFPPELRHDDDVCHGCAERELGIVH